jgi:hypothetical protein
MVEKELSVADHVVSQLKEHGDPWGLGPMVFPAYLPKGQIMAPPNAHLPYLMVVIGIPSLQN